MKNKQHRFVYIAFTFHPPVGNFAGCGEIGYFLFVWPKAGML